MVNKCLIIGNLGKDPEVRYSQAGAAIASFTVATTETWKKQDGSKEELTEWHRVVCFGKLGEICGEYLKKGSKVFIEGRLQTRKWQDKEGRDCYTTEIVAREMKMLSSRNGEHGSNDKANEYQPPSTGDDVPF